VRGGGTDRGPPDGVCGCVAKALHGWMVKNVVGEDEALDVLNHVKGHPVT
jgi:hypothetical protein